MEPPQRFDKGIVHRINDPHKIVIRDIDTGGWNVVGIEDEILRPGEPRNFGYHTTQSVGIDGRYLLFCGEVNLRFSGLSAIAIGFGVVGIRRSSLPEIASRTTISDGTFVETNRREPSPLSSTP